MKARQLFGSGSFRPDQLKVLYKAFDDAWDVIAPSVSSRAAAVEAARMKLANVILSLAQSGNWDAEQIKDAAVQSFGAGRKK